MDEQQLLLEEKKHKELIEKLDAILKCINNQSTEVDMSGVEAAIVALTNKKESDIIPKAILALSDVIISKIANIKKEKKEWTFKVERDSDGFIDVVKATSN